ncbi:Meiosis-specific serine/threonine-protein kinase mek1 [Tulasnella sp. JGI-2019a]|nr:Meiosis-specific serine/threonine-protein kinase mek1 [Tulasnella sp. JGI-2019a]KAG9034288.1 Meiosis-specific serine/threonine-protein kinase mek1 [Tulasnella sp. JGI-2019a]
MPSESFQKPPRKRRRLEGFEESSDWSITPAVLPELDEYHAKLVTRNALGIPEEIYIALDRPVTVGRYNCTYTIQHAVVSKLHFKIYATRSPSGGIFLSCQDFSRNGMVWNNHLIHKTAIIVAEGDTIQIPESQTFRVCVRHKFDTNIQLSQQVPGERSQHTMSVKYKQLGNYLVSNQALGDGSFGKVRLAIDKTHHRQLACKTVNAPQAPTTVKINVRKEIAILRGLTHTNINRIVDVLFDFQSSDTHIFLELCTGGDLLQFIELRKNANLDGGVSDGEAKYIGFQLMLVLQYLHTQDICHRDLKPENVLIHAPGAYPRIMLADFGFARDRSFERTMSVCGTVSYVPPEGFGGMHSHTTQKGYLGTMFDCWSLGCCLYFMISGMHPFDYGYREPDEPPAGQYQKPPSQLIVMDDRDRSRQKPLLPPMKRLRLNSRDDAAFLTSGVIHPMTTLKDMSMPRSSGYYQLPPRREGSGCDMDEEEREREDDDEGGGVSSQLTSFSEKLIKERIQDGRIRFHWPGWMRRRPAMLLISKLLRLDPTERVTIDQALKCSWIMEDLATLKALRVKKGPHSYSEPN